MNIPLKRAASAFLILIMLVLLIPAVPALAETDVSSVRVRLTTNNATSIVMSVTGEYFINENGKSFSGGSLTLRAANGVITATHSTLGELYSGAKLTIKRTKMDPSAGSMYFNSRRYLGHFNIRLTSSGYIQVVNDVPLPHYLYGVVAYEMNNNYPLEALKAQAIAAKCYVMSSIVASPDAEYHIGDTSSDQVYKGYNSAYTNVINAVNSTINYILTVNGSLLRTYYSASNGGETNLVTYAWPTRNATNAGYAISIDDYDFANAYSLCETVKLPIMSEGTISQGMYDLILAKAYATTGVQPTGIAAIKAAEVHSPKLDGTARNMSKVSILVDVTSFTGTMQDVTVTFNVSELYTYRAVTNANLRTYWGAYSSDGSAFYIYHVRWGHGVGLSQRGAQQRASAGYGVADILAFYYPGATLTSISIPMPADPVKPSTVAELTPTGTGVTTGKVNIRTGASKSFDSLGQVARGTALTVYELKDGWYHVLLDGSTIEGWISESYVKFTAAATATPEATPTPTPGAVSTPEILAYGICTGEGVNFRTGPGTGYERIKKLAKNTELSIVSSSGSWYCAVCGSDTGYISASYVKLTATVTPSPSPSIVPSTSQTVGGGWNEPATTQTPDPSAGTATATPSATPTAEVSRTVDVGIITAAGINFRKGPDVSYDSIKKLAKDTGVFVLETTGNWYKVAVGNDVGYVYKDYVKITGVARMFGETGTQTAAPESSVAYGTGVTTGNVNMRENVGVESKKIKSLPKGTTLKLWALKDGWYSVELTDGAKGWVSAKYISVTAAIPEAQNTGTTSEPTGGTGETGSTRVSIGTGVTTAQVNFREGAGTSSKVITLLSRGTAVTLYSLQNGWYEAEYNGKTGYLYAKYVKVTASPEVTGGTGGATTGVVPEGGGVTAAGGLTLASGATTARVNFRTKASTDSGTVMATLAANTSFYVLGECGEYYYILYSGKTGFVYKAYAKVTASGSAGIIAAGDTMTLISTSTTAEVNLREGRGIQSAKIKTLAAKTPVTVYLVVDGWCLVNAGGVYGYVIDDYVKLS